MRQSVTYSVVMPNAKKVHAMSEREILKNSFNSSSNLWNNFIASEGDLNTLYYPSAGEDLRPFVFSKKENLDFMGLNMANNNYIEPSFFIFSDYFPYPNSRFFDSKYLYSDNYTSIYIEDFCELFPADHYRYTFDEKNVHFKPSQATGKAIFFKAKINSHKVQESFYRYAIYFFYENVGLIHQLFLINKMPFSHIVWKRDGSGLGGGNVKLDFIYSIASMCKTKYFFLWDHYLNDDFSLITESSFKKEFTPEKIRAHLSYEFKFSLNKKLVLRWDKYDRMNLYFSEW
jgi:hypothetical protein